MNTNTKDPLYFEQLEIEAHYKNLGVIAVQKTYNTEMTSKHGDLSHTSLGQRFISHQFIQIKENIKNFIEEQLKPKRGVKPSYVYILKEMTELYYDDLDELYSIITLATFSTVFNTVIRTSSQFYTNIAVEIAREIYYEVKLKAYMNAHPEKAPSMIKGIEQRVEALYRRAYMIKRMEHDEFTYSDWKKSDSMHMTASFMQILLATSNYFEATQSKEALKVYASIHLLEAWRANTDALLERSHHLCPTVIPPKDWESLTEGAYYGELQHRHTLLRLHNTKSIFSKKYIKKVAQIDMSSTLDAINALQKTPWHINIKVLEVLQQLVSNGGGIADIPFMKPIPKLPKLKDPTPEQLKAHKEKAVAIYKAETRRKSQALRTLSHLRYAEDFKKYDRIYFPCNMDFRGRIYPIPSFSFQGDDLNKSLLLFADTQPITDVTQLQWFYVTGANLAGVDKVSFDDRIAWVKEHHEQILSSAKDPVGYTFWADQDCPCQFLAFCFEYQSLIEHVKEHGTAKGWTTGLPIAFDGTCSGLQHFSAILRDPKGAAAVNLLPADKPQDIYGVVAEKVNHMLKQDALYGTCDKEDVYLKKHKTKNKDGTETKHETEVPYTKYGSRTLAQLWLSYGVTRKVTKRPVMTLSYGSKEYGFREQILEDTIKPALIQEPQGIFKGYEWQAAGCLAKLIWIAVGQTVVKAVEGMKWLQDCAKLVAKEKVVAWTTPMGLPIQQTYVQYAVEQVQLRCAGKRIRLYQYKNTGNIDQKAQAQGIAPNFIHSMDAAHLQLTIKNSVNKGIYHFSMIHDSYAAPLAQAEILYTTIRESFIELYTQHDVFADFKRDLQTFSKVPLPEPPAKGNLDLSKVMESQYIFS